MTGLLAALRGLLHRAGISLNILLVAVVAVAAVTIGPAYYAAAQSSVVQDTVGTAAPPGRGLEITQSGPVDAVGGLVNQAGARLARYLGGGATLTRLFARPVTAAETTVQANNQTVPLVYRSGVCAHLHFTSGHCPRLAREVAVSTSAASLMHWHTGQRIPVPTWGHLVITGQYQVTLASAGARYWFEAASRYFPYETSYGPNASGHPYDAMFTPLVTMEIVPGTLQGTDYADYSLIPAHLTGPDVARVQAAVTGLIFDPALTQAGVTTTTSLPATLGIVRASWRAIEVPVVLITAQLLLLAWLLLFLIVADAAEARGPEVALAKMRGRGRWRSLTFSLGEPVILLAVALPVGVLAGWAITAGLGHILLRPGTPVGLPISSWLAAAIATVGGLAAVAATARRTLSRSVVDQWQRAGRQAAQRGWVLDAILITAAVAGLIELRVSGQIGSARRGVLGLLLPGLLGVAVAVVASRLLIVACRAGFGATARRGRIGPFLALRHVARRPGGMRTTIVLATAFALAGFAAGIWTVTVANIRAVADARAGAATVLSVTPPARHDLAAIVDRIDPGGRQAMAVDEYANYSGSGAGQVLLAVEPAALRADRGLAAGLGGGPPAPLAHRRAGPACPGAGRPARRPGADPVHRHPGPAGGRHPGPRRVRTGGGRGRADTGVSRPRRWLTDGHRPADRLSLPAGQPDRFRPLTHGRGDQPPDGNRVGHGGRYRRPVRPRAVDASGLRADRCPAMAVRRRRGRELVPLQFRGPGLVLQDQARGESRCGPGGPAVSVAGPGSQRPGPRDGPRPPG